MTATASMLQTKFLSDKGCNIAARPNVFFGDADGGNANCLQSLVPGFVVHAPALMPVIPVNLDVDVNRRNKEIKKITKHMVFLYESYAKFVEANPNKLFRIGLTGMLSRTFDRTKARSSIFQLGRIDRKYLFAMVANTLNALRNLGIACASYRAISTDSFSDLIGLYLKRFTAKRTIHRDSFPLTIVCAFQAAIYAITVRKAFSTPKASFIRFLAFNVTMTRTIFGIPKKIVSFWNEDITTLQANQFLSLYNLTLTRTGVRTELARLFDRMKLLAARFANFGISHSESPGRFGLVCFWGNASPGSALSRSLIGQSLALPNYIMQTEGWHK